MVVNGGLAHGTLKHQRKQAPKRLIVEFGGCSWPCRGGANHERGCGCQLKLAELSRRLIKSKVKENGKLGYGRGKRNVARR